MFQLYFIRLNKNLQLFVQLSLRLANINIVLSLARVSCSKVSMYKLCTNFNSNLNGNVNMRRDIIEEGNAFTRDANGRSRRDFCVFNIYIYIYRRPVQQPRGLSARAAIGRFGIHTVEFFRAVLFQVEFID